MSVTTTENPVYQTVTQVLVDYGIHHTGQPEHPADASAATVNPRSQEIGTTTTSPSGWPSDHRRIPPHRPINRDLDFSDRPWGSNGIETAFVAVMFTGVGLNALAAQTWRRTIGKWTGVDLRYNIGGER